MRRFSFLLTAIATLALPSHAFALPVVSIYSDQLSLTAHTAVESVESGEVANLSTYSGSAAGGSAAASTTSYFHEYPCGSIGGCGSSELHYASAGGEYDSSTGYIGLRSYSYVLWDDGPSIAGPTWDGITPLIQDSIAELTWVFSVSEDTSVTIGHWKDGGSGLASIYLHDETTGSLLIDEGGSYLGEYHVFNLLADHRYFVNLMTIDSGFDDDSQAYASLDFLDGTIFQSVPSPGILGLFLTGLFGLGFARWKAEDPV